MYYLRWGLHKPAFDNVPDPSMYVDCHASMENAIAETLFAIEEGDECIAVIVGDVGLGKTMTIRMVIDSLDQEKYRIALITNPGISFVQMLQEIIGQLTGAQCTEKRKVNLLETFNRLLFSTLEEGRKILIFIDEANAITPMNLEQLRLLTNMQSDRRNLFTMILAGQIEFARRLEHPKRANLFQRVGTYSRIEKLESAEKVRQYVETRLKLAGTRRRIFADDAFEALWEQADRGVPRLVNKIAKLCLKAGETNGFDEIRREIVEQIASRFHKLSGPAMEQRRSRITGPASFPAETIAEAEEGAFLAKSLAGGGTSFPAADPESADPEADLEKQTEPPGPSSAPDVPSASPQFFEPAGLSSDDPRPVQADSAARLFAPAPTTAAGNAVTVPERSEAEGAAAPLFANVPSGLGGTAAAEALETPPVASSRLEMCIGQSRITIDLPEPILRQSLASSQEHRYRLAGGLAAETLRKHPDLIASQAVDPVPIWVEIRDFVLNRLSHDAGR